MLRMCICAKLSGKANKISPNFINLQLAIDKKIEVAVQQVGFTNETIMHKRQDSGVPVYPYR